MDNKPKDWTDSERARLNDLAAEADRRKWLADLVKRWALWITAIIVGGNHIWEILVKALEHLKAKS